MKKDKEQEMIDVGFGGFFVVLAVAVLIGIFIWAKNRSLAQSELTINKSTLPYGVDIVTIDSCQYLMWSYGPFNAPAVSMTHKANCPNHGGKR